jgi:hypothetical protein
MAAGMEGDNPEDLATLDGLATALADAVEVALPAWVERAVERRAGVVGPELRAAAADAGQRAAAEIGAEVRALLRTDVDDQRVNPLALLRRAVRYPTEVLQAAGVAPAAHRDEFAERAFPADVYDLSPATWADVDESLHERGIVWGAAKAHVVLARRRREGKR